MLPNYPQMTPNSAPYLYQSTRSDPTDTNICKPVAIISHDNSLTLVTCLQTNRVQDNNFICQHQERRSDVSGILRASLIQDLQRQSCCVYTMGQDGRSVQEPVAGANGATLAELKLDDLAAFMQIDDEQMNLSVPNDLDSHRVNEEAMQRLLPPEVVDSGLTFTQQGASTSGQAAPSISAPLTQEKIGLLTSLIPYEKRMIYCVLEILELNKEKSFTKGELIELIKKKYTNFDNARSAASYNRAFSYTTNLDLIRKSRHIANANIVIYSLGKYGSATYQYLQQEVSPTLSLRQPVASHSTADN